MGIRVYLINNIGIIGYRSKKIVWMLIIYLNNSLLNEESKEEKK